MKVEVKTKGVILTSKQKSQVEKQILKYKKFIHQMSPVLVEVTFADESGPNKGGVDQTVRIHATLPKEDIYIEEIDDRAMRAFQFASKTLERRLRRFSERLVDDKRRQQGRFKAVANVVGGAGRVVSSAAERVGRIVPKKNKEK